MFIQIIVVPEQMKKACRCDAGAAFGGLQAPFSAQIWCIQL